MREFLELMWWNWTHLAWLPAPAGVASGRQLLLRNWPGRLRLLSLSYVALFVLVAPPLNTSPTLAHTFCISEEALAMLLLLASIFSAALVPFCDFCRVPSSLA